MDVIVVQMLLNRLVCYSHAHLVVSQLGDVIIENEAFLDKFDLKEFFGIICEGVKEVTKVKKGYKLVTS